MFLGNDFVKYFIYKYLIKEGMWIYILIVLYFSGLNNFLYCFKKSFISI